MADMNIISRISMWHCWFILYFTHSTVTVTGRESIPPTVLDPETYICSTQGDNSTYFSNQYIECQSDICEVRCDVNGGCHNLTINASSSDLEMNCTKAESCYEAHIYAQNLSQINVECSAFLACRGIVIEADTMMNELNLNCMNNDACYQSNIHCPRARDAPCNIHCLNQTSCQSISIFINDALDNTLALDCSNSTECTGIIYPANPDFTSSNFMQNPITNSLYCDPFNIGVCPFVKDTITCPPDADCVVDCSNKTNTTCVGYKIDATNANSLSLECGAGFGCEQALVECPIRNDTFCNITCNSCRQIFIKPSIVSTIACIGPSSCEYMLLSLHGHFNQFNGECDGYRACYYASIIDDEASLDRLDMKCNGDHACYRAAMSFQMSADSNDTVNYMADEFHLTCTGYYPCFYLDFSLTGNIDKAHIQCGISHADDHACYLAKFVHSGQSINALHFECYGDMACKWSDIYLNGEYIKEFVWDCMGNENKSSFSACDSAQLFLEASADQINVTCSGYNTCYSTGWFIGSSTTSSLATINQWNLQCIGDGVVRYSDGDQACLYANIYVYAGKRIRSVDIGCDGDYMACYSQSTSLYGDAVIDYWNMECLAGPYNCDILYLNLNDDSVLSHANVNCNGDGRNGDCLGTYIQFFKGRTASEPVELVYNCNTPHACEGGEIDGRGMPSTLDITVNCNAPDSCRDFVIDPKTTGFYAGMFGKLTLNCNNTNACNGMTIECPYESENGCHIVCSTHDGSCANMSIVAVDTYYYRYLNLDCPSPETYTNSTSCDGITITCGEREPLFAKDVEYIYDYGAHEYTCSNASAGNCCPLNGISYNPTYHPTAVTFNPTMPTSEPSEQPSYTPTIEPTTYPSSTPTFMPIQQQVTSSQTTDEPTLTINNETMNTWQSISIVVVCWVLLIGAFVYIYRRNKAKKMKQTESNMQHEPGFDGDELAVAAEDVIVVPGPGADGTDRDVNDDTDEFEAKTVEGPEGETIPQEVARPTTKDETVAPSTADIDGIMETGTGSV